MPKRRVSKEDAASFKGMGLAVIELREGRSVSKTDLANKAGIAASTLRDIERGDRDARWGTLRRLSSLDENPLDAMSGLMNSLPTSVAGRVGRS